MQMVEGVLQDRARFLAAENSAPAAGYRSGPDRCAALPPATWCLAPPAYGAAPCSQSRVNSRVFAALRGLVRRVRGPTSPDSRIVARRPAWRPAPAPEPNPNAACCPRF